MIEIILAITKYTGLFVSNFYGYLKLSKTKIRWINLLDILVAVIFATCVYFITNHIKMLVPICLLLLTFLYLLLRYRQSIMNTATYSVIACGVSIVATAFAFIISIPISYIAFNLIQNEIINSAATIFTTSVLQLIFVFLIYKIKRFKSGLSTLRSDGYIELLIFISILSIILLTLFYFDNINRSPVEIIILAFIFFGLGLFSWWKKHVTSSYQRQVYKRNVKIYEQRIDNYESERKQLLDQNEKLSKIIHRDNKLIPAMVMAVKDLIDSSPDNEDLNRLLSQLDGFAAEHREIIENYRSQYDTLPKTNDVALDAILRYISSRALQSHVALDVKIEKESLTPLQAAVTEPTDLSTILCDLSENAIIAARKTDNGKLRIEFGQAQSGAPYISFYDNGALFDEKVIANMGKSRITTHAAEGGSGIGLMTLFEILNKYNASFCLDERPDIDGYTKLIKISFDGLHKKVIISAASQE